MQYTACWRIGTPGVIEFVAQSAFRTIGSINEEIILQRADQGCKLSGHRTAAVDHDERLAFPACRTRNVTAGFCKWTKEDRASTRHAANKRSSARLYSLISGPVGAGLPANPFEMKFAASAVASLPEKLRRVG